MLMYRVHKLARHCTRGIEMTRKHLFTAVFFPALLLLAPLTHAAEAIKPGAVIKDCADCPDMVSIPAGRFEMGSTSAESDREKMPPQYAAWEKPRHGVTIAKPFALGRFEITKAQYAAFVAATAREDGFYCRIYDAPGVYFVTTPGKSWKDTGFKQADDEPVVCVSWYDAVGYAQWLSAKTGHTYRLPTEAEWEYAARTGSSTARHWGDAPEQACEYANGGDLDAGDGPYQWGKPGAPVTYGFNGTDRLIQCRDGYVFTSPVGHYKPNAFGLYDMLGNAWEWMADCFHDSYTGAPTDGSAWDGASEKCASDRRINRSASWAHFPWGIRSSLRNKNAADARFYTLGFRLVRDITP